MIVVNGRNVFEWPEYLALAKRLGIDLELPTKKVTICIAIDDRVTVHQEYLGRDQNVANGMS